MGTPEWIPRIGLIGLTVIVVWGVLGLLAAVIVLFGATLVGGVIVQWRRSRRHIGRYRVRLGPVDAGEVEGVDLDDEFDSVGAAREAAKLALVGDSAGVRVAFVLAECDDGQWDVVDRVDVLE